MKKWIGFVVVTVILAAFAVVAYAFTRPPDTTVDAAGRNWVAAYEEWSAQRLAQLDRAIVRMEFGSLPRNARLIAPLGTCTASLGALGEPPELLESVHGLALDACGRAEHAARLNERFDTASLASIKLHLSDAEDRLQVAQRALDETLAAAATAR